MENFSIEGISDFIKVTFEEVYGFPDKTCHWGGYELRTLLEIKSIGFYVKSILWTSTGELFEFYEELRTCNQDLKGVARFESYEGNLKFIAEYDNAGHVTIKGTFSEQNNFANKLQFEFTTDQTFISSNLSALGILTNKYGGMKGINK